MRTGWLRSEFSKATQSQRMTRNLAIWDYMTSQNGWKRTRHLVTISLSEIKRYLTLTGKEIKTYLEEKECALSLTNVFQRASYHYFKWASAHARSLPLLQMVIRASRISKCHDKWEEAKEANDFSVVTESFKSLVENTQKLAKRKARLLELSSGYEALVDEQTPGLKLATVDRLVERLIPFCQRVLGAAKQEHKTDTDPTIWKMNKKSQDRIARRLLTHMGFDFGRGKLAEGSHPICVGSRDEVRITLRYNEDDFLEAIMDTLHEGGHALYRQKMNYGMHLHPIGHVASQGVDEAMALIMENCIGRTPEFAKLVAQLVQDEVGEVEGLTEEAIHQKLTQIQTSTIRAYADEARYPLDLIVRYKVAKDLIDNDADPKDLPQMWKDRTKQISGQDVVDDRTGCLQDIHWYSGQIGYFMNYLVGILFAHQVFDKARKDNPELLSKIEHGNFKDITGWLTDNVYRHGATYSTFELIEKATGEALSTQAYENSIIARYAPDLQKELSDKYTTTVRPGGQRRYLP